MKIRDISSVIVATALVAGASALIANSVNAQSLVYNYASHKWEKPKARVYRASKPKAKYQRRTVAITTSQKPGTVIIDTKKHYLYYVLGKGKAVRYGVGVGREGFGWEGEEKFAVKPNGLHGIHRPTCGHASGRKTSVGCPLCKKAAPKIRWARGHCICIRANETPNIAFTEPMNRGRLA